MTAGLHEVSLNSVRLRSPAPCSSTLPVGVATRVRACIRRRSLRPRLLVQLCQLRKAQQAIKLPRGGGAIGMETTAMSASWVLWLSLAAALWILYKLLRFIRSEVDMSLAAKGLAPPGAFRGKTVWITGASQGLGKALALYFSRHGSRLVLSARSERALKAVQAECLDCGAADASVVAFDLCSGNLSAAVDAADAATDGSGIDLLIHNAGASQRALAEETIPDVVHAMFAINTIAPINLSRAALPLLLRHSPGRIVAVSSMAAVIPSPGQAVYSACKSALNAYCATLLTEMNDRGLGVTICCLGPVATGTVEQPRTVYGASGLQSAIDSGSNRLSDAEAAAWLGAAAHHGLDRVWISRQPVLSLGYAMQYLPSAAMLLLKRIGPARSRALKSGKSGYNLSELAKASRSAEK